jgi:hypothetical protein
MGVERESEGGRGIETSEGALKCVGLGRDGRAGNDMTQAGELIEWLMTC